MQILWRNLLYDDDDNNDDDDCIIKYVSFLMQKYQSAFKHVSNMLYTQISALFYLGFKDNIFFRKYACLY